MEPVASFLKRRTPLLLFAAFYLVFALSTYRDYGITWDEPDCYLWGDAYVQYLQGRPQAYQDALTKAPILRIYSNLYGAAQALANPSINAEKAHALNLGFAFLAFWALFELLLHSLGRPWAALAGPLLLFLTPRFTGHLPNNPHDMPFAVLFTLSLAAVYAVRVQYGRLPFSAAWIAGLGLLFGVTHSLRIAGYSLFPILVLFLAAGHFTKDSFRKAKAWRSFLRQNGVPLVLILGVSHAVMFASFPYLHTDPLGHWWEMLRTAPRYYADQTSLFMGREVASHLLPLSYLPVWFAITTPLAILVLAGMAGFLQKAPREGPLVPLMGLTLGVQAVLYFLLRPTMLDGLRVYLFLLPVLATLAAAAVSRLSRKGRHPLGRKGVLVLAALSLAVVASHMVGLHPYPNLYFNELVGGLKGADGRFDTDYWGASYKEAVEWLCAHELKDRDPGGRVIGINTCGNAMSSMYYFGPGMVWVPFERADYFICFTRWRQNEKAGGREPLHVVTREGVPLNYVYRLR